MAYSGGTVHVGVSPHWQSGAAEQSGLETGQLSAPSFESRL